MTFRSTKTRVLALPAAALLAVGLLSGCAGEGQADAPADTTVSAPATSEQAAGLTVSEDGLEVSYEGVAGKTALELLLELDPSAEVSGEGEMAFVTGINGRTADQAAQEFWSLSVNGEMAQVGAGSLVTEDGDVITWTLETWE